jgi:hypothetical protein
MDREVAILLIVLAAIGLLSLLAIFRRQRLEGQATANESTFAVSTEGEKRCPKCGMGNLVTSGKCVSCGEALRG